MTDEVRAFRARSTPFGSVGRIERAGPAASLPAHVTYGRRPPGPVPSLRAGQPGNNG